MPLQEQANRAVRKEKMRPWLSSKVLFGVSVMHDAESNNPIEKAHGFNFLQNFNCFDLNADLTYCCFVLVRCHIQRLLVCVDDKARFGAGRLAYETPEVKSTGTFEESRALLKKAASLASHQPFRG
jgi:hypothetical protein